MINRTGINLPPGAMTMLSHVLRCVPGERLELSPGLPDMIKRLFVQLTLNFVSLAKQTVFTIFLLTHSLNCLARF